MIKQKVPKQEQGFTIAEVLVSILIITLFIAIAMQMMVVAAVFKAHAKQSSEAINWIQQDMENVKYQAAKLKSTTLVAAAATGDNVLKVSWVDGFQVGDTLIVGTDNTSNTISSINSTASPPTLTLSSTLGTAQGQGVAVIANNQCYVYSLNTGFAYSLQQNLPVLNASNNTKIITGKKFTITRNTVVKNISPFTVLELNYSVTPTVGSTAATMYVEVIPNVAFRCQ